jgi:multidrug transporter EmrE-like cation transporter
VARAADSGVYTVLATSGLVLLRRALGGESLGTAVSDPRLFAGAVLYAASFGTFLLALRRFELLTVYPIFSGLAYATITVAAWLFLDESLSPLRLTGILLVGGGVALLAR